MSRIVYLILGFGLLAPADARAQGETLNPKTSCQPTVATCVVEPSLVDAPLDGAPLLGAPAAKPTRPELCPLEQVVDWCFTNNNPITAGDPDLDPSLWQRTWGYAGFYGYPAGDKMAPNGVEYEPYFSLELLLNIGLVEDRSLYLTVASRYWTQKPGENITNSSQGKLDFSKRQIDLDLGVAWNYFGRWELRGIAYSGGNINRGNSLVSPYGFKDGFYLENRFYLPSTNFDHGLYRFFNFGYYFSKDIVDGNGKKFNPGAFFGGDFALDFCPGYFYGYVNTRLIFDKDNNAKLWLLDGGFAFRPFESCRDLEFRLGADMANDIDLGISRALYYGHIRLVW